MNTETNEAAPEEISMSEVEMFEALLDTDIDNIEDLPEFETFPLGNYRFKCEKMELAVSVQEDKAAIKAIFSMQEVLELVNEEDEVPTEGALVSQQWGKEFGIKLFKKTFVENYEPLGIRTTREFVDIAAGLEFIMTIGQRKDPEKLDDLGQPRIYNSIKTAILA